jgi:hypothetical protein
MLLGKDECLANQRKMHFLLGFNSTTPKSSPDSNNGKSVSKRKGLNKKTSNIISVVLIAVIIVSCFALYLRLPSEIPPGENPGASTSPTLTPNPTDSTSTPPPQSNVTPEPTATPTKKPPTPSDNSWKIVTNANGNLTSVEWKKIATYAWNYFVSGVNSTTGLPGSGSEFSAFTDWDIGMYLQAIMDAQKLGVISQNGTGGASERIDKIMVFLETRELTNQSYPYWFYTSLGTVYHEFSNKSTSQVDVADTGRLLIALNNLKSFDNSIASRVDNFVYNNFHNRSDYAALVPGLKAESQTSKDLYAYCVVSGFACFWPTELSNAPNTILNNILSADTITYGNVTLPKSNLMTEPLYSTLFELNAPPELYTLTNKVYAAHETYYTLNGKYRAFSEGITTTSDWAYEWTVFGDKMWVIKVNGEDSDMSPMIYTKTAFCFLAVHNSSYAKNLAIYLESVLKAPIDGYNSGVDEARNIIEDNTLHTNGLIIEAAWYAVRQNP